jgi:hypothetical protein
MKSAIIALLLLTSTAMAQGKQTWIVDQVRQTYDDATDLGKAMNICAKHRFVSPSNKSGKFGVTVEYEDGWESCNAVHEKWTKSDEVQSKAFVDKVAK